MSEEKNTLNVIDDTIKAVEHINTVLNKAKQELINLESEKERMEQEKAQLEEEKQKLEEETKQLERDKQERDEKIGAMSEEQQKLLDEYDELKVELAKFAKISEDQEKSKFNFERIKALLSIYSVLINDIWSGHPHYRVLMTLHGEKETMSREEIKMTTGIGGAFILRAVNELANVDLVEHDIDTGMVKLKKRLFEKEALDKKES